MTCPWCGYENQPQVPSCGDCGRSLEFDAVCASCSTPNPTSHRFCDACGVPLAGQTEPLGAGVVPARGPTPLAASAAAQAPARRLISVEWRRFLRLPSPGLAWDQPTPQWCWSWSHVGKWAGRNRFELGVVVLLTIAAGILRIYRVAEVPGGLPGDEALTGLDALRIVREGWIGPYVGSALGQTTGPLYFTALVFALSEPTTFTLHMSMALFGVATIPAPTSCLESASGVGWRCSRP